MSKINTIYGDLSSDLMEKFAGIKLLACDVDGVFSDGRIYLGNQGEEFKAFHTLDGYGIKAVMKIGIEVAIITGRRSNIVEQRMKSLGVKHVIQGSENKQQALMNLQRSLSCSTQQTASIGDDMPDTQMFELSELALSVPNGHPLVKQQADYVTRSQGGFGAVREVCDLLLQVNNALTTVHGASV